MKTLFTFIFTITLLWTLSWCLWNWDSSLKESNIDVSPDWKIANSSSEQSVAFAKCLKEKWAKFYWTNWCSHCQKQKELLWWEQAVQALWFIDCDANKEECTKAQISAYPTWIINGSTLLWTQSIEALSQQTWCQM